MGLAAKAARMRYVRALPRLAVKVGVLRRGQLSRLLAAAGGIASTGAHAL